MLNELQTEMPELALQELEFASPEGSEISIRNGILYPPAVFLNGTLLAKGKIDVDMMSSAIRNSKREKS